MWSTKPYEGGCHNRLGCETCGALFMAMDALVCGTVCAEAPGVMEVSLVCRPMMDAEVALSWPKGKIPETRESP